MKHGAWFNDLNKAEKQSVEYCCENAPMFVRWNDAEQDYGTKRAVLVARLVGLLDHPKAVVEKPEQFHLPWDVPGAGS